jgi:hypothetical protein
LLFLFFVSTFLASSTSGLISLVTIQLRLDATDFEPVADHKIQHLSFPQIAEITST